MANQHTANKRKVAQWNPEAPQLALSASTGEELKRVDPERYQAIVRGLKDGMPIVSVAKVFGASDHTVIAIAEAEGIKDDRRIEMANNFHRAALKGLQVYNEALENNDERLDINRIPINSAIAIDKYLLLQSERNANAVEIKISATKELLQNMIESAKKAKQMVESTKVIDADVIESES